MKFSVSSLALFLFRGLKLVVLLIVVDEMLWRGKLVEIFAWTFKADLVAITGIARSVAGKLAEKVD